MTRKILFQITIGSAFLHPDRIPTHMSEVEFPQGGESKDVYIEFEEVNGKNVMTQAEEALRKYMNEKYSSKSYHIWYWNWLN